MEAVGVFLEEGVFLVKSSPDSELTTSPKKLVSPSKRGRGRGKAFNCLTKGMGRTPLSPKKATAKVGRPRGGRSRGKDSTRTSLQRALLPPICDKFKEASQLNFFKLN